MVTIPSRYMDIQVSLSTDILVDTSDLEIKDSAYVTEDSEIVMEENAVFSALAVTMVTNLAFTLTESTSIEQITSIDWPLHRKGYSHETI